MEERCPGIFSTFLTGGAPELQGDERWLRAMIEVLLPVDARAPDCRNCEFRIWREREISTE